MHPGPNHSSHKLRVVAQLYFVWSSNLIIQTAEDLGPIIGPSELVCGPHCIRGLSAFLNIVLFF